MRYVIGADAGTTCFKAGLYDEKMRQVAAASEEYTLLYSAEGYVELPAERYWEIFCSLIRSLLDKSGVSPSDVAGLAICSQGETMILLDGAGKPLRNAIVWTDARAGEQADRLREQFPDRLVFEVTGQRGMTATWPATKLLWVREHEPEVFAKTAHILLLEDYLIYRLTGKYATDYSLSSSVIYLDIYKRQWWPELCAAIGITQAQLPALYDSGEPIAPVDPALAADCGLTEATMVMAGALDQASGMLGAGNIRSGMLTETTGTCLAVCANVGGRRVHYDEGLLPVHYGIAPDSYYAIYWSAAAGSIYRWVRDVFYRDCPNEHLFRQIDGEAAEIPPGSEGLLLLPYLSGMNYPAAREEEKGAFLNLTLFHTRAHFARAVLESIAYMLRQSVEEIQRYGVEVSRIYSLGGGSASPVWNQIKADVTGKEIVTLAEEEVTCRGAGMIAAVGAGIYPDFEAAVAEACRTGKRFAPERPQDYEPYYAEFQKKVLELL